MINPKQFAASTLELLQANPRNYRNFGTHWYFVKALMKRFYTADNLYLLGDFDDPSVTARMEPPDDLQSALSGAVEEYQENACFGMGAVELTDDAGEKFILIDADA
jgi:hypothetical protein